MKKPFTTMYKQYRRLGEMERIGLCGCMRKRKASLEISQKEMNIFHLFEPTLLDRSELVKERKNTALWASGDEYERLYQFTNLRQIIVLFCAAINKEL